MDQVNQIMINRRTFLRAMAAATVLPHFSGAASPNAKATRFDISLSQWSFHRAILGNSQHDYAKFLTMLHQEPDSVLQGKLDPRDIVVMARQLGVAHVDLVNILWFGHAQDKKWLSEFKARAANEGVGFKILMCDQTGSIGHSSAKERASAIENHLPWFEAAAELGCNQLRVNAYGEGSYLEQLKQSAESLAKLAEIGQQYQLEVLVENHGYASNNGAWLAMLMQLTNHDNVGVFTDFDNFFMGGWNIEPQRWYDRTQGLIDLAPYTKSISAKAHHFNSNGLESTIDYGKCLDILVKEGFNGVVSAEFEGSGLTELEGSKATVALLRQCQ